MRYQFYTSKPSKHCMKNRCMWVGASVDITPAKPVALVGQLNKRISQKVLDPLTATALALETRDENGVRRTIHHGFV